jgi:hypothetical protein
MTGRGERGVLIDDQQAHSPGGHQSPLLVVDFHLPETASRNK